VVDARAASIRAIVFDLDGTLIDSRRDIVQAVSHVLAERGFAPRSEQEIVGFVGDGARRLLARAASIPDDDPRMVELMPRFLEYYTAHAADHSTLMPGALVALAGLTGYALALCTNKPRVTTDAVLTGLALDRRFKAVVAGGDVPEPKPHPGALARVAELLDVPTSALVMVGDGAQDVECGQAAGALTVGVRGGMGDAARLEASRPDRLIDSLAELPAAIGSLLNP
jgi:phosphoglycolate phosphatase